MNSDLFSPDSGAFPADLPPVFNIVILYEDGEDARSAKRLSDMLHAELGDDYEFSTNLWSFDVLSIPDVSDAAADTARNADLLIISLSGECELPPHVERWLDVWSCLIEDSYPAMAAVFKKVTGRKPHHIHLFLSMLAGEKKIDYFPHTSFEPRADFVRSERKHLAATHRGPSEHDEIEGLGIAMPLGSPHCS